jgi:hypothetical protein
MRTHSEQQKSNTPQSSLKEEKKLGPWGACWVTSLAAKNFDAYLCSLPVLA